MPSHAACSIQRMSTSEGAVAVRWSGIEMKGAGEVVSGGAGAVSDGDWMVVIVSRLGLRGCEAALLLTRIG